MSESRTFAKALGPGLLFAGAAIGVSHLVQSTRAGAEFGLGMVVFLVLANVIKYPAFSFGPLYAAATGTSLLEGYRRQGRWALVVYLALTIATMFTVEAAVAVVTAGLAKTTFGLPGSPQLLTLGLIVACGAILAVGQFRWLDRVIKVTVALLTVSTLVATVVALPRIDWRLGQWVPSWEKPLFIAALIGWMPSAIDISVWHSLWTLARRRESGHTPSVRESLLDFKIGYFGTAGLALCFLLLGAGVMYGSGETFSDAAGEFAGQIIDLYAQTLGEWSRPLLALCAFAVMLSTTLTVVDGFARALASVYERFGSAEDPGHSEDRPLTRKRSYWLSMVVIAIGSCSILQWYISGLSSLVDLATTISFLTAPVLAFLNHRAVHASEMPAEARPSRFVGAFSAFCVALMAVLAIGWLYVRFGSPT